MTTKTNNLLRGRVIITHLGKYITEVNNEKYSLEVSGRFKYMAFNKSDFPVVGDYVYFRPTNNLEGIIERVEERTSTIKRLAMGEIHNAQIVASNIDLVFICMSLNNDYKLKKLQNFLTMTYSYDYESVILLTKSDLSNNIGEIIEEIQDVNDEEIMVVSSFNESDITKIKKRIGTKTCVFIGSSGVGKSTIINKLINDEHFETNDIRLSDSQGRHTTVHRELIHLDDGGSVIDTPGIRITESYTVENMDVHFGDILGLAKDCRYRDCNHTTNLGCNVLEALNNDELPIERYEQYLRAERLNRFIASRERQKERIQDKRMHKRK